MKGRTLTNVRGSVDPESVSRALTRRGYELKGLLLRAFLPKDAGGVGHVEE